MWVGRAEDDIRLWPVCLRCLRRCLVFHARRETARYRRAGEQDRCDASEGIASKGTEGRGWHGRPTTGEAKRLPHGRMHGKEPRLAQLEEGTAA